MTNAPFACQIYPNSSYVGACQQFVNPPPQGLPYEFFFAMMGAIVVGYGLLIITKYYEYPYGRYLWRFNGILGFGISKALSAAVIGKLYKLTEKYLIFVPMGSKKQAGILISAMPESVHQIEQKAGGLSFTLVDLDVRTTVSEDVAEWAEEHLGELTDTRDWPTFLFKWKWAELVEKAKAIPRWFPQVVDWNPGMDLIWLPSIIPKPGQVLTEKVEWNQKYAKDASAEERVWYMEASKRESDGVGKIESDLATERNMLTAAIGNQKTYLDGAGKQVILEQRDKFAYGRKVNEEFANAKGKIKDALIGGKTVPAQRVAEIMRGVADPEYVDALRENIRQQEAKKKKADTGDLMKVVIAAGALVIILVVAVVALNKFG